MAELHKALGDPTRIRILLLLNELGELCGCDIEAALEVSQSKASRHLTTLKRARLVSDRRSGTWVYYSMVEDLAPCPRAALSALLDGLKGDKGAASEVKKARKLKRSPGCK